MASPSPVPPYCRVMDESAWANASKIAARLLSGMPMPVSSTVACNTTSLPADDSASMRRTTSPVR